MTSNVAESTIPRKPIGHHKTLPSLSAKAPTPPPSYNESAARENDKMPGYGADYAARKSSVPRSFNSDIEPMFAPPSQLDLSFPPSSTHSSSTQTSMPVPLSAENKRATLTKPPRAGDMEAQTIKHINGSSDSISKPSRLQKDAPDGKAQRLSGTGHQRVGSNPVIAPMPAKRQTSPAPEPRGRSTSAQVPPSSPRDHTGGSRVASTPTNLRPAGQSQSPSGGKLRRSWLPGGRSRSNSTDVSNNSGLPSYAWVMSDESSHAEYNTSYLVNAEKVPELWNENGDVLVYLYPKASGCGPSFKMPEFAISSSAFFNELIHTDHGAAARSRTRNFGGRASLGVEDVANIPLTGTNEGYSEGSGELRLYLPIAPPSGTGQLSAPGQNSTAELDRLIAIRNLFAFLTGQPLVGTRSEPTIFRTLLQVASLLQEFGFSSDDGFTFGPAVDMSFGFFMEQLGLADCRHSREKTIEALVLGERMRSMDLYSEAFAHAAGKYSAIVELKLPVYDLVSPQTRQSLERAHLDLINRQHNVNEQLEQFEFPSLFAGLANSTSRPELKHVRFKAWKNSFNKMRQFVMSHYKATFGNWPPKASSKKNPFAESGLNRLVLKVLYSDMCALYDLLVDRNSITSRVIDEVPPIDGEAENMTISALRNILSEYDRARPPVLPPIPFDLPQLPSMTSILETYNTLPSKEQAKLNKKLKEHELLLVLNKAYNIDTNNVKLPFLDEFKEFEARESRGKVPSDLVDQRIGFWLFLYAVLQSLPMLVVDAPGINFSEGVEYFLCVPPMGNPPWVEDKQVRKMWYEVAGGGGLVELSTDTIMFSVEATYHRSHCWLAAKSWQGLGGMPEVSLQDSIMSPLQPPPTLFPSEESVMSPSSSGNVASPSPPPSASQVSLRPHTLSPAQNRASHAWRSSIALGLEPVPLDAPPAPRSVGSGNRSSSLGPQSRQSLLGSRTTSSGNVAAMDSPEPSQTAATSGLTFDDILGDTEKKPTTKKKSKFF